MYTIEAILNEIIESKANSAWKKGVKLYAIDLVNDVRNSFHASEIEISLVNWEDFKELLLDGAKDWKQFSEGGLALIYDCEIAERLCTPSELKRTKHGYLYPNKNETWLDVQTRALIQACDLIETCYHWIV